MTRHSLIAIALAGLAACTADSGDGVDTWHIEAERVACASQDPVCPGDPDVLSITVRDDPSPDVFPEIVEYADIVRCDPRIEASDPEAGWHGWAMLCGGADVIVQVGATWSDEDGALLSGDVYKGDGDCSTCWDITAASVE